MKLVAEALDKKKKKKNDDVATMLRAYTEVSRREGRGCWWDRGLRGERFKKTGVYMSSQPNAAETIQLNTASATDTSPGPCSPMWT